MKGWILIMTVAAGCGGSARRAEDPATRARNAERERIEAMKPEAPYETRAVRGYRAPTTCGQGPYRIEAAALGARFGEQLEVNLCAPRSLQGDLRFSAGTDHGEPRHFGSRNNSEHCVASASEAGRRDSGSTTPASNDGRGATSSGAASTGARIAAPVALVAMTDRVDETCPDGMYLTGILDYSSQSATGGVPWPTGTPLVLEVWSAEPLHLEGATFVVIQRGVRADMTVDGWTRYDEAYDHWRDTWNAFLAGEVSGGRAQYLDTNARTADAPPPPRAEIKPPRPSTHAEWIAGYWQRERDWIWSAGFWRVPESDVVAEQTSEAPRAPPPVRTEAPPPPVSASASVVWTPGYWAWDGTVFVWIEGAWRTPPQGGARWIAPSWTPRRGRVVLVPGGWSVRLGR